MNSSAKLTRNKGFNESQTSRKPDISGPLKRANFLLRINIIDDYNKINYYINISIEQNLSERGLIKNNRTKKTLIKIKFSKK